MNWSGVLRYILVYTCWYNNGSAVSNHPFKEVICRVLIIAKP